MNLKIDWLMKWSNCKNKTIRLFGVRFETAVEEHVQACIFIPTNHLVHPFFRFYSRIHTVYSLCYRPLHVRRLIYLICNLWHIKERDWCVRRANLATPANGESSVRAFLLCRLAELWSCIKLDLEICLHSRHLRLNLNFISEAQSR